MAEQNQPQQQTYENFLMQSSKKWDLDKSFTDKLLSRQDSDLLKDIIKKDDLSRQDLSELISLLTLTGSKLANYSDYDRYILGKYFTWIDGFINLAMGTIEIQEMIFKIITEINTSLYDFKEQNGEIQKIPKKLEEIEKKRLKEKLDKYLQVYEVLTKCRNIKCDDAKYLTNLFNFMSNSTLSIGAAAFDTLSTNRFEYSYPGGTMANIPTQPATEKKSIFKFWK